MLRGAISYLRSLYQSSQPIQTSSVVDLFYRRIQADHEAHAASKLLSSLNVSPTNALISVVSEDDHMYSNNGTISPLGGIPIVIKDNFCVDSSQFPDLPTTCGSHALYNFRSPYNAAVVTSLLNDGAILMGKANLDEFAMGCGSTDNPLNGAVINPWSCKQKHQSEAVIAGGSSGGSAAAVAAGLCIAALASDTGGSARLPAAYCGVVGLKPTYSLLPRHGLVPLMNTLDVPSIITSRVTDAAAILASFLRPSNSYLRQLDATCIQTVTAPLENMLSNLMNLALVVDPYMKSKRLRIGIPVEYHTPGLSSEMCHLWDQVAGWMMDEFGHDVSLIQMPHTPMATTVYSVLCATEVASNMCRYDGLRYGYRAEQSDGSRENDKHDLNTTESLYAATRSRGFGEVVRSRILTGNFFLLRNQQDRYLDAARRIWRLIKQDFDQAFEKVDFLLTPTTLGPPISLSKFCQYDNRTRTTLDDVCTVGANLAGVPALSIPIAISPSTGLPLSLQLIGPRFSEDRLLYLGAQLEYHSRFPLLVDLCTLLDTIS